jgi:hypothetical protein
MKTGNKNSFLKSQPAKKAALASPAIKECVIKAISK